MDTENSVEVYEMVKEVKATLNKEEILTLINEKLKEIKDLWKSEYQSRIDEEFNRLTEENKNKFFKKNITRENAEVSINSNFPLKAAYRVRGQENSKELENIKSKLIEKNEISLTALTEILEYPLDINIENT